MTQNLSQVTPTTQFKRRTWSIRVITLLLILQATGIAYLSLDLLSEQNWQLVNGLPVIEQQTLSVAQTMALETATLFIPLTLYTVVAILGFFFMLRGGWLLAMIMQSLILAACLILYFRGGPTFLYVIMLYCIVMVLYLNSFEVRVLFDTPDSSPRSKTTP